MRDFRDMAFARRQVLGFAPELVQSIVPETHILIRDSTH